MANTNQSNNNYRILAVTACPTGIAHTYMSAEALAKEAAELGVAIKIETDGAIGIKNELTTEEILACDGIIVAADQEVSMERFHGKPVILTTTAAAIHHPQELLKQLLNNEAGIYDCADGMKYTFAQEGLNLFKHHR